MGKVFAFRELDRLLTSLCLVPNAIDLLVLSDSGLVTLVLLRIFNSRIKKALGVFLPWTGTSLFAIVLDFKSPGTLMELLDANPNRASQSRAPYLPNEELLRVCDLSVNYRLNTALQSTVLRQVGFAIGRQEIVGLLGESGCGKTTTALAILQLLPPSAHIVKGSIEFHGQNLLALPPHRLRGIRGFQISIIYQDSDVLNPVMRVGDQVMEVLRAHRKMSTAQMRDEVFSIFAELDFDDCERIFRAYPHQLSGGQRRRIAIAQALVCKPRLVIADEPTAWLDSNTTAELLTLFTRLKSLYETAFLLISHDPNTLGIADRVLVMYAGQIIESGTRREVLDLPKHPYTQALLGCSTYAAAHDFGASRHRLPSIPGCAPDPSEMLSGCSFASRCDDRMAGCDSRQPQLIEIFPEESVRCFKYGEKA
jgi:peptide/nickel transport system ATP-binding protein